MAKSDNRRAQGEAHRDRVTAEKMQRQTTLQGGNRDTVIVVSCISVVFVLKQELVKNKWLKKEEDYVSPVPGTVKVDKRCTIVYCLCYVSVALLPVCLSSMELGFWLNQWQCETNTM